MTPSSTADTSIVRATETPTEGRARSLYGLEAILLLLAFFMLAAGYAWYYLLQRERAASETTFEKAPPREQLGSGQYADPPLLVLSEAAGYSFELGSAKPSRFFRQQLEREIAPKLLNLASAYDLDLVEVVGHTDDVPVAVRGCVLDRQLPGILNGGGSNPGGLTGAEVDEAKLEKSRACDNAGLGLLRALTVAHLLRSAIHVSRRNRLALPVDTASLSTSRPLEVIALSAGQWIDVDGRVLRRTDRGQPAADPQRRRIEIRLRKLPTRE